MSDTLYEKSNTGDDGNASIGPGANWEGQTFTPTIQHTITSVKLYLHRDDGVLPGTVTVSIRATAASLPTGADLVSGTYNADSLTPFTPTWVEFTFGAGTMLLAGTQYAKVIRVSSATDQVKSRVTNPGTYSGGSAVYSSDSGGTWTDYGTFDYQFEEYGIPLPGEDMSVLFVYGETLHYVSHTGVEYAIQGTPA